MSDTIKAEVAEDGMVHIPVPNAEPGDQVRISMQNVSYAMRNAHKRIGWLKGVIEVHDSFDDPIEGLP